MRLSVMLVILTVLAVCVTVNAAVPPMINYQGKLMQPSGASVPDGTYSMQFAIYDVPTGGTPLWSETNPVVQVKGGLFAVMLGSVVNLPANVFDSPNRFFGVKVGSDPEMTPRQQVASSAFAFRAATAGTVDNGSVTTEKLADGAVTTPKVADAAIVMNKIADESVTSEKLAGGSITTSKIDDGAVTASKIADGAVTAGKLQPIEPWSAPTLLNGWSDYGLSFSPAGFYKDVLGVVHLRGLVRRGTLGADMFVLPEGYRPTHHLLFACESNLKHGRLDVTPNGEVRLADGDTTWVSLDGISFREGQ